MRLRRWIDIVKVRESLVGKTFGRLTVIKQCEDYVKPNGQHFAMYTCECNCGNPQYINVAASHLKNGHTQSCGCLQKEKIIEASVKRNKYDLSGEYGIGWTNNTNKEFYFDLEDYDKIKNYTWYADKDGYIVSDSNKNKRVKQHRVIMNVLDKKCDIDHINGRDSKNDNRKSNLRICSRKENIHNKIYMSNNTSGCIGVTWNEIAKKWQAGIGVNKKQIHLGLFKNKEDAFKARIEAENKYYGEFAPIR